MQACGGCRICGAGNTHLSSVAQCIDVFVSARCEKRRQCRPPVCLGLLCERNRRWRFRWRPRDTTTLYRTETATITPEPFSALELTVSRRHAPSVANHALRTTTLIRLCFVSKTIESSRRKVRDVVTLSTVGIHEARSLNALQRHPICFRAMRGYDV
jgi:hypothetical protein